MKEFWNVIQLIISAIGGWLGWFLGGCDGLLYGIVNNRAVKKHPKSEINKNMPTKLCSVYAAKAALQREDDVIGCQPAAKPVRRACRS